MNGGNVGYVNVSDVYKATLKSIEFFSEKFLKFIPRAIPDYPSHGADHSKEILALLDRFIGAWQLNLTEKEDYLLYLGAWVHDIGNINGRGCHNEKSAEILDKIPFFGSVLGKEVITLLKWVVKVHSSTCPVERVPKDCLGVRLQLICSIFRIIDACEIGNPKCPNEVYEFIKDDLDTESNKYWKAHISTVGMSFKLPKIRIVVDDPEVSSTLIDHIEEEMAPIKGVLDSNGIPVPHVEVAVADATDHDYVCCERRG